MTIVINGRTHLQANTEGESEGNGSNAVIGYKSFQCVLEAREGIAPHLFQATLQGGSYKRNTRHSCGCLSSIFVRDSSPSLLFFADSDSCRYTTVYRSHL